MNARKMALAGLAAILLAAGPGVAVDIDTVPVGNPGNAADTRYVTAGTGAVAYEFSIGKYEVSNAEYVEFLNAVDAAGTDPYDLYTSSMGSGVGGITFTAGNPNGSKYSVRPGRGNMPVNWISFWDACRFANWLHNGQGSGDTETGAYTLTPDGMNSNTVTRNAGWQWAVTSEDEWYKAAYYDGGTGVYYDFPTGSDTAPTPEAPPGTDMTNGSANYGVVGDLTDVGAYTAKPSTSRYGTFDQAGNVMEWNEAIVMASYRSLRGGCFECSIGEMRAPPYNYGPPWSAEDFIGFRVSGAPVPATPGDANLDGAVDGGDYTIWADHYYLAGCPPCSEGGWAVGNFSEDDRVDGADYTIWADHYTGDGGGSTVPGPATLSLLMLGGLGLLCRRRWAGAGAIPSPAMRLMARLRWSGGRPRGGWRAGRGRAPMEETAPVGRHFAARRSRKTYPSGATARLSGRDPNSPGRGRLAFPHFAV